MIPTENKIYKYLKLNIKQIALMSFLLALYTLIKYICSVIFRGPLNFNIEIIFWILNGILFGPLYGPIFSLLCDTVFTLMTGIIYWMIEYAIVAPIVSLITWIFWKSYRNNNKWTIITSFVLVSILITSSLVIFFIQLFGSGFRYEGVSSSEVIPLAAYILICFLCISIFSFTLFCFIKYKKNNDWQYIRFLYWLSLVVFVIIICRWLWGPYAFLSYSKRFISPNIDFKKQYPLSLFGIVTKSCLTIPIACAIVVPLISVIDKLKINNEFENRFN